MLIYTDLQPNIEVEGVNWTQAAQSYPNLEEAPSFTSKQREIAPENTFTTSADPHNLQGKQLHVYTTVCERLKANSPPPLKMIVSGTAGTGKSYLQVWQPLTLMVKPSTVSLVYPPRVILKTWKETDFINYSSLYLQSSTLSLMRCPWLEGRLWVKWTDVFGKPSLTMLKKCLEDAHIFSLETLASFLL